MGAIVKRNVQIAFKATLQALNLSEPAYLDIKLFK